MVVTGSDGPSRRYGFCPRITVSKSPLTARSSEVEESVIEMLPRHRNLSVVLQLLAKKLKRLSEAPLNFFPTPAVAGTQ